MTDDGAGSSRFRGDIQGLRAVAVLLVVAYHAGVPFLRGGFVGVDVFFVISGYLITGLLQRELSGSGRVSFRSFYARRARRILPAAAVVIVATVIASSLLSSPLQAASVDRDGIASSLFAMNYRLAIAGAAYLTSTTTHTPLQHFWSLSVEEQFYALWPVLLVAASFGRLRGGASTRATAIALSAIGAGSFAASVVLTTTSPSWAYYALWTRAWELAAGGLLALGSGGLMRVWSSGRSGLWRSALGWAGLGAIVVAATVYSDATAFPGWAAALPVGGAVAVIAAGPPSAGQASVGRLLGVKPSQAIGRWSYSWYLWHFPLLVLVPVAVGHSLTWWEIAIVVAVSLAIAATSYRFVEQPFRSAPALVARPLVALGVGAALIVAAASAGVVEAAAVPSLVGPGPPASLPFDAGLTVGGLQRQLTEGLGTRLVPSNLTPSVDGAATDLPLVDFDGCEALYSSDTNPPCVFGDRTAHFTVALFGDSHAAQWFPALQWISHREQWRLVTLAKSGCPPVEVDVTRGPGVLPYPGCAAWRAYAIRRMQALRPQLILVSWDRRVSGRASAEAAVPQDGASAWASGVAAMYASLKATGARVIDIGATPQFPREVPHCVSAHLRDAATCNSARSKVVPDVGLGKVEARLAAAAGVPVIDPLSWFCTPRRCPVVVGDVLVYRDADHMTPQWSLHIAPVLLRALQASGA